MRKKNVIVGLSTAALAFGVLYLFISYEAPEMLQAYCQRQVDNNIETSVDSCIESHESLFPLRNFSQ